MSPYHTFDSISKFAELLAKFKKDQFVPRVTTHNITENTEVILIEPACGSNTAVIRSFGKILRIDSGYTFYAEEMRGILRTLISDYDTIPKSLLLTHADVDHCGLMTLFDEVPPEYEGDSPLSMTYIREKLGGTYVRTGVSPGESPIYKLVELTP